MVNYLLFIFFYLSIVLDCHAQKQFVDNDTFCDFEYEISKSEKKIEITKNTIDSLQEFGQIEILNTKNRLIKLYNYVSDEIILMKWIHNKKTNIDKVLEYNKEGKLVTSAFFFNEKLPIGQVLNYQNETEVTQVKDYRQAKTYPVCYKEALAIVKSKIAKKDSIFSISREKKYLKQKDTLYYWDVFVRQPIQDKNDKTWIYRINAKNGKLIKKTRAITVHRSY